MSGLLRASLFVFYIFIFAFIFTVTFFLLHFQFHCCCFCFYYCYIFTFTFTVIVPVTFSILLLLLHFQFYYYFCFILCYLSTKIMYRITSMKNMEMEAIAVTATLGAKSNEPVTKNAQAPTPPAANSALTNQTDSLLNSCHSARISESSPLRWVANSRLYCSSVRVGRFRSVECGKATVNFSPRKSETASLSRLFLNSVQGSNSPSTLIFSMSARQQN